MPDLLIKVSRDLAIKLKSGENIAGQELARALASHGAHLAPPFAEEGEAAQYFRVTEVAGDRMEALRLILAATPGVEAAYIKPGAELP